MALQYLRTGNGLHRRASIPELLRDTFGADAAAVAERYPLDRYGGNVPLAYSAAVTDGVFACVAERMGDELARAGPVYAYEFNDRDAPAPEPLRTLPFPVGASHSLELRYLFDVGGAPPLDPAQQALSDQMIDYWSRVRRRRVAGRRGPAGVAGARRRRRRAAVDVVAARRSRVVTDFDDTHQCAFWATCPLSRARPAPRSHEGVIRVRPLPGAEVAQAGVTQW